MFLLFSLTLKSSESFDFLLILLFHICLCHKMTVKMCCHEFVTHRNYFKTVARTLAKNVANSLLKRDTE